MVLPKVNWNYAEITPKAYTFCVRYFGFVQRYLKKFHNFLTKLVSLHLAVFVMKVSFTH